MTVAAATALAWHALIAGVLIGAWLTATLTSLYFYLRRARRYR
jgi:hypothetical protein